MRLMIDDDPARETLNPQIDANMAHTLNQIESVDLSYGGCVEYL
jgi:hypothetical protein